MPKTELATSQYEALEIVYGEALRVRGAVEPATDARKPYNGTWEAKRAALEQVGRGRNLMEAVNDLLKRERELPGRAEK